MEIPQGNSMFSYLYLNKQKCHVFLFIFLLFCNSREQEGRIGPAKGEGFALVGGAGGGESG
jgi:hypothetical protein